MLIDIQQCPMCKSKVILPYGRVHQSMPSLTVVTELADFPANIELTYAECVNCGLVFQTPRMDDMALSRYYAKGWYRAWLTMSQKAQDEDEKRRAESVFQTITILDGWIDRYIHLDVGCSRGFLLEMTKNNGMNVCGVEPNKDYVWANDIPIVPTLDDVEGKFNLITSIHTLEHVPYPVQELKKYAELLEDDGVLILEVPGNNSPGGAFRLAHLSYFRPFTLRLALQEAGMKIDQYILTPHQRVVARKI